MSYLAGATAFFCETFSQPHPSVLDLELDEAVSAQALARGSLDGYCNVSATTTAFSVTDANLRENVISHASGSGNRHRQLACALSLALFENPLVSLPATIEVMNARRERLFLTETTTPFHHAVKRMMSPDLLTTSEYFGPEHRSGDRVGDVRHEDLQCTSFADGAFDLIVTSDVMEHVPDALTAEREIVRILKPGGHYCFTVPLHAYAETDAVLAALRDDGTIEYFHEPVYHGDPIRPTEGVLVYRIFSIKEMTERFAALGATCTTYRLWSKGFGLIGPGCWVHVVRKHAA